MSGFGTSTFGLGPYGLAGSAVLSVDSAYVTSERSVVVVLTKTPLQNSTIGVGDALNPASWSIVRTDDSTVFHILASRLYTGTTEFELYTLEKFYDYSVTHTVAALGLVEPSGASIVVPTSTTFPGCKVPKSPTTPRGIVDLANPPFADQTVAGNYQVDSTGDYVNHSGEEFLRKIIIRRLSTDPGGFFYLDQYGLGLQLKEPIPITDLGKLKAQIELQVGKEPEFSAVSARVGLTASGILSILVRVLLSRTNQEMAIPIPVSSPVPSQ